MTEKHGVLCTSLRVGSYILIGDEIEVRINSVKGLRYQVSIRAPKILKITFVKAVETKPKAPVDNG